RLTPTEAARRGRAPELLHSRFQRHCQRPTRGAQRNAGLRGIVRDPFQKGEENCRRGSHYQGRQGSSIRGHFSRQRIGRSIDRRGSASRRRANSQGGSGQPEISEGKEGGQTGGRVLQSSPTDHRQEKAGERHSAPRDCTSTGATAL